ncbi:hypothetical protein GH984_04535 [Spiribacter sp. C176]|uniref:ABC transporter substrate-binding protein n=2 Tax=Spiribacter salilacus TaxID=2664894 RepID=A0A6N7QNF0_9GAMM|nr:hypothetical protein [Spiribacter salilacus]
MPICCTWYQSMMPRWLTASPYQGAGLPIFSTSWRCVMSATMLTLSLLLGLLISHTAFATNDSPEAVVDRVVRDTLEAISDNIDAIKADDAVAQEIVDTQILPWFDTQLMARFTMGRLARQASEDEISRFTSALEQRIANLYVDALKEFATETVDFAENGEVQLRTVSEESPRAVISARVIGPNVEDTTLRLQLYYRDDRWRVFDVETSGVSLLIVFRDALQPSGRDGGIPAMIAALEEGDLKIEEALEAEVEKNED